jgi:hypothetical protein
MADDRREIHRDRTARVEPVTDEPFDSAKTRPRGAAVFGPRRIMLVWALAAIAAGCGSSQAAPSTGTNAVTVISVDLPSGGTAASGRYYVVATVQFQATSDLLVPTTIGGFPVPVSYAVFVCVSVDGVLIADTCGSVSGSQNTHHDVAVLGPDARRNGPSQTNYVVAFMIKAQDVQPFAAGTNVPAFALAKDVKPWVINWQ